MTSIKEFDIRSRGFADLIEQWKLDHHDVRRMWKVEDLVAELTPCCEQALELFDYFRENGFFPNREIRFGYYAVIVELILKAAKEVDDASSIIESQGYEVRGIQKLRDCIARLSRVLEEDRFATDAAFAGGALDDWD